MSDPVGGTCIAYSKNAIPQLIRMTRSKGAALNFRCPYQAKVMKIFDISNKPM